jgi:hypothetical protein
MGFMPGAGFAGLTVHLQHEWDFSPLVVITLGDSEEPSNPLHGTAPYSLSLAMPGAAAWR